MQIVRSRYDKVMNARRQEVIGYIPKATPTIQLAQGVELSAPEQARCDAHVAELNKLDALRDELALLSLPETVERAARWLEAIEDAASRAEVARILLFAAGELTRKARKHVDLTDADLAS
jgi:hypothetical protein